MSLIKYMKEGKNVIKIEALSKKFGEKKVLDDMFVEIKAGTVFGLLGPNGAGKSTLLNVLSGIMKPDSGNVLYDGEAVYDNPEVKRDILLISDDPYYFFHATIKDMKEFYKTWYPRFDNFTYHKFLTIFSLDETKPMKDFSKGMKRQAFIAIALAIAPKYLFLDEAFDGLDPIMRLTFKRAISEMIEEKDITVLISSHNLRELEDICDSYGILENGKMTSAGNIDDAKGEIHKIQIAFKNEVSKECFQTLDILSIHIQSRVVNMVVKGDIEKIKAYLQTMEPLMLEVLNVNLEEIFIYEMERKGYGVYEGSCN